MRAFKSDEEEAAYYAIVRTWLTDKAVRVPKERKLMCDKLVKLQRKGLDISGAIFAELQREEAGSGPWSYERGEALCRAVDERIEAWSDAQLGINPPIPQTPLEELLHERHRLRWAEWNLCDEIEKRWGAVSPLLDTRPGAVPRPCPYA